MGLPIAKILAATNANDIVHRALSTGDFSVGESVPTASPAMDIQLPYNLERLIYFCVNQDPRICASIMQQLESTGAATLDPLLVRTIREVFVSSAVSDAETLETIRRVFRGTGYCLCPHSAIPVHAVSRDGGRLLPKTGTPVVSVATAHPAKFEHAVGQALEGLDGAPTGQQLYTPRVRELFRLPTRFRELKKSGGDWRKQWEEQLKRDIADCASDAERRRRRSRL